MLYCFEPRTAAVLALRTTGAGNKTGFFYFITPAEYWGLFKCPEISREVFMKLKKILSLLIVAAMMLCIFAACGSNSDGGSNSGGGKSGNGHYPVTIDTYNYAKEPVQVTFEKKPEKVVCTNQTQTELMLYFGLDEYIAGMAYLDGAVRSDLQAQYDALKAAGKELTVKGYPQKEVVLALEPDFIFGWRSAFAEKSLGDVSEWHKLGVGTMILRCSNNTVNKRDLDAVLADIADIGKIFDIEDKTNKYIEDAKALIAKVDEKVASLDRAPYRAIIIEPGRDGTWYCWGSNTLTGNLVVKAGAEYGLPAGGNLSVEDIVKINPEVIIVDYMEEEGKTTAECEAEAIATVTSQAALAEVPAVANGKIMAVNLTDVYGGGIRMVPSVEAMFNFMYGQ